MTDQKDPVTGTLTQGRGVDPLATLGSMFDRARQLLGIYIDDLNRHITHLRASDDGTKEATTLIRDAMRAANTATEAALKLTAKLDDLGESHGPSEIDFDAVRAEIERRLDNLRNTHNPD